MVKEITLYSDEPHVKMKALGGSKYYVSNEQISNYVKEQPEHFNSQ